LKKVLEEVNNKNSILKTENSKLMSEKEAIEVELDKNIDDTLVMLGRSFFRAIRQAHVLYNGPPPSDESLTWMCSRVGSCRAVR